MVHDLLKSRGTALDALVGTLMLFRSMMIRNLGIINSFFTNFDIVSRFQNDGFAYGRSSGFLLAV